MLISDADSSFGYILYDDFGVAVLNGYCYHNIAEIDMANLRSGVYILILANDESQTYKVIKK